MAEKRATAPSGMAGLVRYFEEDKSLIKLKPEHVFAITVAIAEGTLFFEGLYLPFVVFLIISALMFYWIRKK